jgi:glutaredoxin
MQIQVLGSGCPTCKSLYESILKIAPQIDPTAKVEYITGQEGMKRIIALGAMHSPVLVVDNKIAMIGYIPDLEKIRNKILAVVSTK